MSFWTSIVIIVAIPFAYKAFKLYARPHKKTRKAQAKKETHNSQQSLQADSLTPLLDAMETRLKNIEMILDDELPDWRNSSKKDKDTDI